MLKAIVSGLMLACILSSPAMAGSIDFQGSISQYSCASADSLPDCQSISSQISRLRQQGSHTDMLLSLNNQIASSEVSRMGADHAVLTIHYN